MIHKDLGFDTKNVLVTNLVKTIPRAETKEERIEAYKAWQDNIHYLSEKVASEPKYPFFFQGLNPRHLIPWIIKSMIQAMILKHVIHLLLHLVWTKH